MRLWFAVFAALFSLPLPARELSDDMGLATVKRVALPEIQLDCGGVSLAEILTLGLAGGNVQTAKVSRFVRIQDENGRFSTLGRLNAQAGKPVAVKLDSGVLREVWILTDSEFSRFSRQRASQPQNRLCR